MRCCTQPTLHGALDAVRRSNDARFAALLAGVFAFSIGFAAGVVIGERLTADEA